MKISLKILFILLASLFMFSIAFAYDGVSGTVYWGTESGDHGLWEYGGSVLVRNCYGSEIYIDNVTYSGSSINIPFSLSPENDIWLCTTVSFNNGGGGKPANYYHPFYQQDTSASGRYSMGNIYTGYGPTAIVLSNLTAASPGANPWLAVFIVVGALAVVSGGMAVVRKRRR